MKIALICTQGGHLTETLQVMDAFEGNEVFLVTHFSPRDEELRLIAPAYFCPNIGERPLVFLRTFVWAFRLLLRERPQVIFSTGSEIALPFFFWGKVLALKRFFSRAGAVCTASPVPASWLTPWLMSSGCSGHSYWMPADPKQSITAG